jgi:A/G-specific adenine glycosylase
VPKLPPVADLSRRLEAWFERAARDLPWRRRRSPWATLVSEMLLQQTQVSRVAERFPEFMRRFPSPATMARGSVDAVLRCWRGLGYYRRARSLHAAARCIVSLHGGKVPADPAALRELPGVGRYTAGAIASIAFGRAEPIVDGNVARVLSRLADRRGSAVDREGTAWCWESATRMVSIARDPGRTNEALMELGATVCTPISPRCGACPLRAACRSRIAGSQEIVPPPKPGATRQRLVLHALVDLREGRVALERRTDGLWQGLLSPPLVQGVVNVSGEALAKAAKARLVGPVCARLSFQTTHRDVRFVVHRAEFAARAGLRRVALADLAEQAISSAALQVIRSIGQEFDSADRLRA